MRPYKLAALCLTGFALTSCSNGTWFGKEKVLNLSGERIKLSTTKNDLKVDPAQAKSNISIPQPKVNDGWYRSSGITSSQVDNLFIVTPIEKKASYKVGSSNDFVLGATPIIVGSKLFVPGASGVIEAFDLTEGATLWSNDYFNKAQGVGSMNFFSTAFINGGLAFHNNVLFATGGIAEVIALKPESGETIWTAKLSSPTRSTPLPVGNKVIIQTIDNKVFTLDASNGKILWTHAGIAEDLSVLATYAPAVSGNNIIVQYSSGEIFAIDLNTGDEVWVSNISSQTNKVHTERHLHSVITSPTVDDGLVLAFGNDGTLASINEHSGAVLWKKDIGINKQFWVSGNMIFAITTDNNLICINKQNGAIKWITNLGGNEKGDLIHYGSPIIANSKVMIVGSNGKLKLFDANTGAPDSEVEVAEEVYLMPVVTNGGLFLLDNAGTITRYGK